MKYYEVRRYHVPIQGGHKVFSVYTCNGVHVGVWNPKRQKVKLFSSYDHATSFAESLNAGIVSAGFDRATVLYIGESSARGTDYVRTEVRRRTIYELSDKVTDTVEQLQSKAEQRQALKVSGLWYLFGYAMDGAGRVTVPVVRDVARLAALTE